VKAEFQEVMTHPVIAAAVGALLGLQALPGASVLEKLGNVAAGFAIAAWGGPALVDYLHIESPKLASGVIFVIGAVGLVVFNAVIEAIKKTDLAGWLAGWLPRRKSKEGGE
jgi:hypothetical protein